MAAREPIRALIVDDEPLAREGIRLLLERDPEVEIVGECGDVDAAARALRAERPVLLFLDVQMPGGSGFDVLARTSDLPPPVVVLVTAYDQYAIRAFDASAIDYLLKPFDDERFAKALSRAKRVIREKRAGEMNRQLVELLERYQPGSSVPGRLSLAHPPRDQVVG
jgi:two-component system LytT family response regulator